MREGRGERKRECEHETKPRHVAKKGGGRRRKRWWGKKGRRSTRMRGCKTIGEEFYKGKNERGLGQNVNSNSCGKGNKSINEWVLCVRARERVEVKLCAHSKHVCV